MYPEIENDGENDDVSDAKEKSTPEVSENELGTLLSGDLDDVNDIDKDGEDGLGGAGEMPEASAPLQPVVPAPVSVPQPVAAPVPGAVPVVPSAAVAPPAPAAPVVPQPQPVFQQQPQQPAAPVPGQPQVDPVIAARENYTRARESIEDNLAKNHYVLPQEVVEKFNVGDFSDIPKMMAKVYMDATTAAVAHVITHFPTMMQEVSQVQTVHADAEKKFFDAWPQLKLNEHGEAIKRFGSVYRQMNPQASADEFIRDVGAQVIVALKVPTNGAAPQVPSAQQPQQPFRPASGRSQGAPPAQKSTNVFAQMAEEVEELDLD